MCYLVCMFRPHKISITQKLDMHGQLDLNCVKQVINHMCVNNTCNTNKFDLSHLAFSLV